jgi:alginate O-acetyltransferase complex protein AlgI
VLGGLWHGAAWTFVAWGALHGAGLVTLRAWRRTGLELPRFAGWALTLLFVMVGWVFFRAASLADAAALLRAMAGAAPAAPSGPAAGPAELAIVAVAALLALWPRNSNAMVDGFAPRPLNAFAVAASLVVCLLHLGRVTPFLYFNF